MTAPQPPQPIQPPELPEAAAFMQRALALARHAAKAEEVPVGAVVVRGGAVVGEGYNQCAALNDPSAHAEMQALRAAATRLGNYRLEDCDVYVTLEPCAMCAQALLHARVRRVFYGAPEPRFGAAGSVLNLFALPALNPGTEVAGGLLADESRALLQGFFRQRRSEQAQARQQPENAPLREDALRTPEARFAALQDFAAALDGVLAPHGLQRRERYLNHLPALAGLRLHTVELLPAERHTRNDEVPQALSQVLNLVLHSPDGWWPESALAVVQAVPVAQVVGAHEVQGALGSSCAPGRQGPPSASHWLLPDLIGFGQSDKPKKARWHSVASHVAYLQDYLQDSVLAYLDSLDELPQAALARSATSSSAEVVLWFAPGQEALAASLQAALPGCSSLLKCSVRKQAIPSLRSGGHLAPPSLAARLPTHWRELPFPDRGHEAARRSWGQVTVAWSPPAKPTA